MPAFVAVAINLPQITDTFDYHLPDDLTGAVQPGSLVIVPFGRQRVQGVVIRLVDIPAVAKTRPVEDLLDSRPALTAAQIELAFWIAEKTLSPLGACIGLMVPPGISQITDTQIALRDETDFSDADLTPLEKRLVSLIRKRGSLRGRQVDAALRQVDWRSTLRQLVRKNILTTQPVLPEPRVSPKTQRTVELAIPPDEIDQLAPLSRYAQVHTRRLAILHLLAEGETSLDSASIQAQTGGNAADLKMLAQSGLITFSETPTWRDPLEDITFTATPPPRLTSDQAQAWDVISAGLAAAEAGKTPMPYLLHGVTGSGKTELYLRAVEKTLAAGKQAIILVPEISLTPQTVRRFLSRFPNQVGVVHSQLSEGERYDTWRRARLGELSIIVGPRSALFLPLPRLGLIVVDECDHESYDQQESPPYYHAAETAAAYARLVGAVILLGSATPRVTQYYRTVNGSWKLIELPQRILAHRETIRQYAHQLGLTLPASPINGDTIDLGLPEVAVVDMRLELKSGNRGIFSQMLRSEIQQVLDTHQQAILFLNRRGTATYVFCRNCGYVAKCPHDDKPLTFHGSRQALFCHTCGYQRQVTTRCPVCGSTQIKQLGTGTEKVEALVQEAFPNARTLRWDAETTRKKGAHDLILTQFSNHQADILIGTQMLAKGLDLPLVTLVGVILAEVGLNLPDYRSSERTFQVLTQVAGRAGRSPLGGKVVIQTYEPDQYAIQTAAQQDYEAFYDREMAYRRELGYPPFKQLVRMEYRHNDPQKAEAAALQTADLLGKIIRQENSDATLIGPAPCFFTRLSGRYRWQIVLRGDDPVALLRGRSFPDWIIEVDPPSLL